MDVYTDDSRRKIDCVVSVRLEERILVIDSRCEERNVATLYETVSRLFVGIQAWLRLTPYDSPAIWKGRPSNLLKCAKKMATKAAISWAASSVVL